ncbi:Alpha-N-acetylgalactosaminide alpha-2,6-sialyltransferase 1 [Gossypium arboreum]|uniref:Alpha-N-acetylgalactosaminide alpha-2,6-sialyltransferase 1 n=1 Tax=Gossypium arboreum TaxID=29729 RepID=A0A0B0MH56_GOSAR|nr:Alpha-N-acetylgalactosaminide alpha-2,6-sialyltransferase 1 [Gossypium arboreum]
MRNGPKIEKMGQSTKSTWPRLPHMGRPYGCVNLARTWLEIIAHRRVTRACPCRAQVESNSEKATFEGS